MNQLELHKRIEEFFKAGINSADIKVAKDLLKNDDAKRFFFSQADESWLVWLWDNKFLKKIEEKAEDSTRYSYRMPELEYLTRMSEKDPVKIGEIIKSVKISAETFNPEVVDRFIRIIGMLPAEQIKDLTSKIRDEKWVYLMRNFNQVSGYDFWNIVKKLVEKKEYNALLELTPALLTIWTKEEIIKKGAGYSTDDPFCVHDIHASGIFEALSEVGDSYANKALEISLDIMGKIVELADKDKTKVFEYEDSFALYDVDFFTLELRGKKWSSYREDLSDFAAVVKKLIERIIGGKCGNVNEVRLLYGYINKLPNSRSMWRLKLFTLAQCPEVFKEELKHAFLKVFEVGERYFEIEGDAEYHQALIRGFRVLNPETEQRDYVKKIFEYFGASLEDKDKEKWRKRDGAKILCFIKEYLTSKEKKDAQDKFGISPDEVSCVPAPIMEKIQGGVVQHKSPVNLSDFTIDQIIENLKTKWKPEKLDEQFKNDDFLKPRGVEGLGDALKDDIKKRTDDYLKKINKFFDRNNIHPHYLYSLLLGVEEMLRNKQSFHITQISQILDLFESIQKEAKNDTFKKGDDKTWLVDWVTVHKIMADILLYILQIKEIKENIHKAHRNRLKGIIQYLCSIAASPSEEDEKTEYDEPYHVAINSVRGRAYEAFVVFTENDGKELADDVKSIYEQTLFDNSIAVRFVIGRYLASFYFRDKGFIKRLLLKIFPKDDSRKRDVYLSTLEGYLSNTLYEELFIELKNYYEDAIALDPREYSNKKYLKDFDKALAVHMALAFIYLDLEIKDNLFRQFWNNPNTARHYEFISFIGRNCLTRDKAGDEWLKENKVSKEKLVAFWDWVLKNQNIKDQKVFAGFGFWINPDKEVLNDESVMERVVKTLERSSGNIDWDYGLLRRLPIFAEKNSEISLDIISKYLLDSNGDLNSHTAFVAYENEIKEALEIIYNNRNEEIKQKVKNLINTLIEKGSSMFWNLKEVIK